MAWTSSSHRSHSSHPAQQRRGKVMVGCGGFLSLPCRVLVGGGLAPLAERPVRCPPVRPLKAMLAERLPSFEHARVATHLEVCTACQHRVEGLTAAQGAWTGLARKLSHQPPAPEPALRQVMDNLKAE